jgi:PAS domain S-box-containing protein
MKLSVRLAIAFFILSTIPVALVSYVSTLNAERSIEAEIENHLSAITEMRAADFDRWVENLKQLIESVAQRPLVVDLTAALVAQANREAPADPSVGSQLLNSHLLPHLRVGSLYQAFSIVDARTGKVLVSTDPDDVGKFRAGEPYYEEGMAGTYVGAVRYTPALEAMTMHVGAPVGRTGEPATGVLVGRVDLAVLGDIVTYAMDKHKTEDVYLVNAFGFFVTEPRFGADYALRRATDSDGVARALAGETGIARYVNYRGVGVFGAFRPLPDSGMAILAEIDEAEALAPVERARVLAVALVAGAVVIFSSVGIILSRRMTDPLRRIAAGAAKIGSGEFGYRIGSARSDELGDAARSFDRMAENLAQTTASRDDLRREIDARFQAEERLRESEEKYRLLFDHAGVGIGYYTPEGVVVGYNRVAAAHMGGVPEDFVGTTLVEQFGEDLGSRYAERILAAARSPGATTYEDSVELPTGAKWFLSTYSRIERADGEVVGVQVLSEEITARKEAEEAIRESERRFRELTELLPEAVYEADAEGRITFANLTALERFRYAAEDVERGLNVLQVIVPEDRERGAENVRRILRGERIGGTEYTAMARDGTTFPVIVHSIAVRREGDLAGIRGVIVDITEQTRVREALQTADEIVSALPSGILIYRFEEPDRLILASGNATASSFVDLEENVGKELETHWPARMVELLRPSLLTIVREGGAYDRETVVVRPGAKRAFHMRAFRIPGSRIILAFEEITERVRAQEALKEEEEKYRLLFEHMIDGFALHEIVLDESGAPVDYVFLEVNAAYERMVGLRREELVGRRMTEALHGNEPDATDRIGTYGRVATTGESARFEQHSAALGRWYSVLVFCPRAGRFAAIFEDITERKRAEAAVAEWKSRYEGAVEASRHILYDWNSETNDVTYAGDVERILGYTGGEVSGDMARWIGLIHPEDRARFEAAIGRLLETHEPVHLEYRVRRKDGDYIHVEHDGSFILDAKGRPIRMLGFVKDVTERHHAAERVEESERRYRAIVDFAPIGIVTVNLDGTVASCNEEFVRIAGFERDEMVGRHFTKLPPARARDLPRYVKLFADIVRGRRPEPFETTWTGKDGVVHYGEVRVALLKREGRMWGIQVIVQDTTGRKAAEDELRESERKYRELVEDTHDVVYSADESGRINYVSPSVKELFGYAPSELLGKPYAAFGFEDDLPTIAEMKAVFARTTNLVPRDYRLVAKDGSVHWMRTASRPIFHAGRFAGLRGVLVDVTAAKQSEEALRISEQRHRSLFENAALGIYQTTPDGRILAANPSLVRMLGYDSFEELATRNLEEDGYEPGTPRQRFRERIERDGRIEGLESIWVREDGKSLHVRENAVAIRDDQGNVSYYEGTVEDITAQREAEDEKRHLEAQLRQTQRLESIGTLASGVAHEINNPLTGMMNYAELISRRVEDSRLKEFAEAIMSEGARVAKIVRNLLSFARHEKESHSPARLADVFAAARALVDQLLVKDRIQFQADVPEDLPKLKCRSQQIQQVILNLLMNARDALNERYPGDDPDKILRVAARVVEEDRTKWVRLVVEDHGVGIPEENIGRIFDPFFTTKPRDRGTGLGLSVSYGIVREHGGRLSVESEEGAFTRMTLDLPVDNGWTIGAAAESRGDDG